MRLGNLLLPAMSASKAQAQQNPTVRRKQKRVEGSWNLGGGPQFSATLAYPTGERTLETELAPSLGGEGLAPDLIQYCLDGLAAWCAGTLVSLASAQGVGLRSLRIVAESQVKFTRPLGLGNQPVVEWVSPTIFADADATDVVPADLDRLQDQLDNLVQYSR